jgi:cob(I)alamin adenosyltransferase
MAIRACDPIFRIGRIIVLDKGYIQLYTGNGKGKTTAALGLALRAAGAGLKVLILQFMKGQHYSELDAVKKLGGAITIEQMGSESFCRVGDENFSGHERLARRGMERALRAVEAAEADIIILDEAVTAMHFGLVSPEELFALMAKKCAATELVLTGRGATPELIDRCDLVTEMVEVKHYYGAGVQARKGIES